MIYRNDEFAEENLDPTGHPAEEVYDEWSDETDEVAPIGHKPQKPLSQKERAKRYRAMEEVVAQDLGKE